MQLVECCLPILLIHTVVHLFKFCHDVECFPLPPPPAATLKYKIYGPFGKSLLLPPPTQLFEIL